MDLSDIKGILSKILPTISSCVGIANPLAGTAIAVLTNALGLSGEDAKDPTKIQDAILGATPEQLLNLKKLDQDFAIQMQTLGFKNIEELAALEVQDRSNARNLQITTKSITPTILSFVITIGFFGILGILSFHDIPIGAKDVINIMLGSLGTAWISVISYYFGSSLGSSEKNVTIDKAMNNKGNVK